MLASSRRASPPAPPLRRRAGLVVGLVVGLVTLPWAGASAVAAAPAPPAEVEIHLITIGVGEHVLTAGGHSALMVATLRDGEADPAQTLIYNFGDADFDDPTLAARLLRGEAEFRLAISGTLQDVVNEYGIRQGRDVWRQRLRLSPAEAAAVAERLATTALPENRNYHYHHHQATCTTKIRDLLDEVTGGALTRDLVGRPATPASAREIQRVLFRRHHLAALGGDLFFGRIHDLPADKFWALVDPPRMMEYLQEVEVPAASPGAAALPLAEEPVPLIAFVRPDVVELPSITTPLLAILAILGLALGGRRAANNLPKRTVGAGLWLIAYPLVSGLIGAAIVGLILFSGVDELRENENVLVFPAADLLLVVLGARWLRRPLRSGEARALSIYAYARLGLIALVIALHAVGVLFQGPRIFLALSLVFALGLVALARRAGPERGSRAAVEGPRPSRTRP